MSFLRLALALVIAVCFSQAAAATTVQINNVSGKTISAIYATPKDEATHSTTNVVGSGLLTVNSESGQCFYTLNIEFSDSTSLERPDVDLCQTETLMVE